MPDHLKLGGKIVGLSEEDIQDPEAGVTELQMPVPEEFLYFLRELGEEFFQGTGEADQIVLRQPFVLKQVADDPQTLVRIFRINTAEADNCADGRLVAGKIRKKDEVDQLGAGFLRFDLPGLRIDSPQQAFKLC